MTKEQMREKLANALSDLAYDIRNESSTEAAVSSLTDVIIELIEGREPLHWRCGPPYA